MPASPQITHIRLDKWLWAARFFKTRQLAASAIKGGKISINENKCKPASTVKIGDQIRIRKGALEYTINVLELSQRRGSATIAQQLYQETVASKEKRQEIKTQLSLQPKNPYGGRKPDKHTIRANRQQKRQY